MLNRESVARWTRGTLLASCAVGAVAGVTAIEKHAPARELDARRVAVRVASGDRVRAEVFALDVWSDQTGSNVPFDFVTSSDQLAALGVPYEVLDPDIDATAAAEHARLVAPHAQDGRDWSADYHDYNSTVEHLRGLAAKAPARVAMSAIGTSLDNRPIWALKIGTGTATEPKVMIEGTLHAREWIASAVTTCIADRLVAGYDRDAKIRDFVDHTTLWVVPVVNPDGYQYTWSTDRYWRKNRRDGYGVDLNRNFGVAFGQKGSSTNKRAEDYRGAYAFSEPESVAVRDLAKREHITQSIDFHAYGQLLLYPWNYTSTPTADRDKLTAIGDRMASAMFAPHDTRYALMNGTELYPASGTEADWMYGDLGATAYTIELRPKGALRGRGGFVLPPAEINPTCDEGFAALLALRSTN